MEFYKGSDRKILGKFLQRVGRISKNIINRYGEIESRNPEELLEFFVYLGLLGLLLLLQSNETLYLMGSIGLVAFIFSLIVVLMSMAVP